MPVSKSAAPNNDSTEGTAAATQQPEVKAPPVTPPNETGQGNTDNPADVRDDQVNPSGFHDSMTGRPVSKDGSFLDGTGQVEQHRVVADNWPAQRDQLDD